MPVETCVNCEKKINDPLGTFQTKGNSRKCPGCGKDFDVMDVFNEDGKIDLTRFMGGNREKRRF